MRILTILGLLAAFCCALSLRAQDTASSKLQDWKVTAEEVAKENPVKPDEEGLEFGRVLFESQCWMCHGVTGDGKGKLADVMALNLTDLRKPDTLKGLSDGALFAMITKGKDKMPALESRLTDEQKWKLINYIRTLPQGGATRGTGSTSDQPASTPQETTPQEESAGPS